MKFSKTKERKENNNVLCEDNDTKFLHTDNIFNKRYTLIYLHLFIFKNNFHIVGVVKMFRILREYWLRTSELEGFPQTPTQFPTPVTTQQMKLDILELNKNTNVELFQELEFDYYDYECHERGCETEVTTTWTRATGAGTSSDMEETWPGVISDMGELDNTAWWTANNDEGDTETEASGLLCRHSGETRKLLDSSFLPERTEAVMNKPPITCLEELEIWDESNDESL